MKKNTTSSELYRLMKPFCGTTMFVKPLYEVQKSGNPRRITLVTQSPLDEVVELAKKVQQVHGFIKWRITHPYVYRLQHFQEYYFTKLTVSYSQEVL